MSSDIKTPAFEQEPSPTFPAPPPTSESSPSWYEFAPTASLPELRARFAQDSAAILTEFTDVSGRYCCLALFDPGGSISSFEADQIYRHWVSATRERTATSFCS